MLTRLLVLIGLCHTTLPNTVLSPQQLALQVTIQAVYPGTVTWDLSLCPQNSYAVSIHVNGFSQPNIGLTVSDITVSGVGGNAFIANGYGFGAPTTLQGVTFRGLCAALGVLWLNEYNEQLTITNCEFIGVTSCGAITTIGAFGKRESTFTPNKIN